MSNVEIIRNDFPRSPEEVAVLKSILEEAQLIEPVASGERKKPNTTYFGAPGDDGLYSHVCGERYKELLGDHVSQVTLGDPAEELIDLAGLLLKRRNGALGLTEKINVTAEGLTWQKIDKKNELIAAIDAACEQFVQNTPGRGGRG